MRSRRYKGNDGESSSYDLSISDLMAALCCVFVLFTIGVTTSFKEKNMAANNYNETKVRIADEIEDALQEYLKNKDVTFDTNKLIIRFSGKLFEDSEAYLTNGFEKNLKKVFHPLMKTLYFSEKRDDIEEIRIEGFTTTDRQDRIGRDTKLEEQNPYIKKFTQVGEGSDHDYITGFTLSQQRTQNVLSYCMYIDSDKDIPQDQKKAYKEWVRSHVSASGYSFIQPLDENGKVITLDAQNKLNNKQKDASKEKSRRVEFRIKTNADKVINQLQLLDLKEKE